MILLQHFSVLVIILSLNASVHSAKPQAGIMMFSRRDNPGLPEGGMVMSKRDLGNFPARSWTTQGDWTKDGKHSGGPHAAMLPYNQMYLKTVSLLDIEDRKKESKPGNILFLNRLIKVQPFRFRFDVISLSDGAKPGRAWLLNRLNKPQPNPKPQLQPQTPAVIPDRCQGNHVVSKTKAWAGRQICPVEPSKLVKPRKHALSFGISYGRG